jgi:hypothetical protein
MPLKSGWTETSILGTPISYAGVGSDSTEAQAAHSEGHLRRCQMTLGRQGPERTLRGMGPGTICSLRRTVPTMPAVRVRAALE